MTRIVKMELVEASNAKDYQEGINKVVEELQALNLEVEVGHSMCQANKGVGYKYSAIVIGRQG